MSACSSAQRAPAAGRPAGAAGRRPRAPRSPAAAGRPPARPSGPAAGPPPEVGFHAMQASCTALLMASPPHHQEYLVMQQCVGWRTTERTLAAGPKPMWPGVKKRDCVSWDQRGGERASMTTRPASAAPTDSACPPSCSSAGPATAYATTAVALPAPSASRAAAGGAAPAGKADVAATAPSPRPPARRAKNSEADETAAALELGLLTRPRVAAVGAGADVPTSSRSPFGAAAMARPPSRPAPPYRPAHTSALPTCAAKMGVPGSCERLPTGTEAF